MDKCIICMGSNYDSDRHIAEAQEKLSLEFPDIVWGETIETLPEDTCSSTNYLNKAAVFATSKTPAELKRYFKLLEQQAGRTPEDKSRGMIPLDIDLLIYGDMVLKPADLNKDYVKKVLTSLPALSYR